MYGVYQNIDGDFTALKLEKDRWEFFRKINKDEIFKVLNGDVFLLPLMNITMGHGIKWSFPFNKKDLDIKLIRNK